MQSQGDPARVQLAYERAVAVFPVTHYLWSQYAKYMEQHLGRMPQLVHAVYQRALRNCPWVGPLWAGALRAAERLGSPQADQESLYNQALQAGMQTQDDYMEVRTHAIICTLHSKREQDCLVPACVVKAGRIMAK